MRHLADVLQAARIPRPSASGSRPTDPESVCPICKGAGYVREDVPVGHPHFGRANICDCRADEIRERNFADLQRFSNLEALTHLSFDRFDPGLPGVANAYQAAREFAADPQGWLIFYGGYGAGKTHLAAAIANELVAQHTRVLFQVVPDLLDHLRSAFSPNSELRYDELFEAVKAVTVLILDDLAEESQTPWAKEKLFQLFNHRYNHRLPTVVTTNRPPEAIDPRIWSRMFDATLSRTVQLDTVDYRARPARERRGPIRPTTRGPTARR
jgi:DNA replication protein DnaC